MLTAGRIDQNFETHKEKTLPTPALDGQLYTKIVKLRYKKNHVFVY